ncbi:trypsin-like peptidase domain-containing protein [Streptomyces afghaniensis]|uniref:nSTAND1 domain-containing NTPase n=1 Tax=Streptomyces afghaniensis TaxID=66865 RepID=UPI0037D5EB68
MAGPYEAGIVRVVGGDGGTMGTGFIASAGLVVTCAHVVVKAGAGPGQHVRLVRHSDGASWLGTVAEEWWGGEQNDDVAVLRVQEAPAEAALLLGSPDLSADRWLWTYGFPAAKPIDGMSGSCRVVGPAREHGYAVHVIESDQVTKGYSGAPVVDEKLGVVVGMVVSITAAREVVAGIGEKAKFPAPFDPGGRQGRTAFMIPAATIRQRCPELELRNRSPYRGLDVLENPDFYYGRTRAVEQLTDSLREHEIAVLVGNSGSGKSSLLRAGLHTALFRSSGVLADRLRCDMVPDADPLSALVQSLADGRPAHEAWVPEDELDDEPGAEDDAGSGGRNENTAHSAPEPSPAARETLGRLAEALTVDPTGTTDGATATVAFPDLREQAARRLRTMSPDAAAEVLAGTVPTRLLLLVDQLERLYTACDQGTADHFVDILLALTRHGAAVGMALRADFYGRALRHTGLANALTKAQLTVLPMSHEELRQAIVMPARRQRRQVQGGLVERLIADVRGRPGALPLLQLTLEQLWKRDAHTGVLTLGSYLELGGDDIPVRHDARGGISRQGVAGAVYRAAEETWYKKLTAEERRVAPAVFLRLVATEKDFGDTAAAGGVLTARRAWLDEWDVTARSVIAKFVQARLLTLRSDPVSGQPAVEIAHEALLEAWPMLANLVSNHKKFAAWYGRDFAPAFQLWANHDRREEFLLPKPITEAARKWCEELPDLMAGPARAYVQASVERIEREQENAWRVRRTADESRSTLWATRALRHDEPKSALALALAAGRLEHPSPTALQALAEVAYRPGLRDELRFGHTAPVWAVAQRAGVLVTAAADKTVIVWDPVTHRTVRTLQGHSGHVRAVALSADGRVAVSGSDDRTVIRWEVTTGRILGRYEGHQGAVLGVAVTPDGGQIVSASADGTAVVWDAPSGRTLHRLTGHRDVVAGVAVGGAEGAVTATCSSDGTVRLWDTLTGELRRTLTGHEGPVWTVAVDRLGRRAVSGSADRAVIVWNLGTGRPEGPPVPTVRHRAGVWGVAFGPDGRTVVSGAADHTVAVWDTAGRLLRSFEVGRAVNGVALDETAHVVFCAGDDHSVTAWRTGSGGNVFDLGSHRAAAGAVALSGDAGLAVVGCANGDLLVWNTVDRSSTRLESRGRQDPVVDVALSRDGLGVLTLSASGALVRRYTGQPARGPDDGARVHPATVVGMALSEDGRICLMATDEGAAYVGSPFGEPHWRRVHKRGVTCVAVDGTGDTLAAGDADGHVHVWTGPGHRHRLLDGRHSTGVRDVAVSGDGAIALSADGAGRVAVWGLASGEPAQHLDGTDLTVRAVGLSHDGGRALMRTDDGGTIVLDLATWELHRLGGPGAPTSASALSADGQCVLTARDCAELGVWAAGRGDVLRVLPPLGRTRALAVGADGRFALVGAEDGGMTLWDLDGGELVERWHDHECNGLALSADGTLAIGASEVLPLLVWDFRAGVQRMLSGHTEAVRCVALTPDGQVAVSGSVDHRVILWDAAQGEFVRSFQAHNDTVHAVAVSPDGQLVVSGSQDASSIIWDVATGGVRHRFGHESAVLAIALSPDGALVACGTADGAVFLCSPADGSRRVLVGHTEAVRAVAFSPDSRFVVSGDERGGVFVWDVTTGQGVRDFTAATSAVIGLECAADDSGMIMISASAEGEIRVWRLHSHAELLAWAYENRLIHRFTCAERSALIMEPGCDPLGNPPPETPVPSVVPLTRAALRPVVESALLHRPGAPSLAAGVRVFDAVQAGRSREWQVAEPCGRMTIDIAAEGIDLDPRITLYGRNGDVLAEGRALEGRRSRIGPVDIGAAGDCTVVVEGCQDGPAGGYTVLLTRED